MFRPKIHFGPFVLVVGVFLLAGCQGPATGGGGGSGSEASANASLIIGESPLRAGTYTGLNECKQVLSAGGDSRVEFPDPAILVRTINKNGIPVIDGEAVRVGAQDSVDFGDAFSGSSLITAVISTTDGVTIEEELEMVFRDSSGEDTVLVGTATTTYLATGQDSILRIETANVAGIFNGRFVTMSVECLVELAR